MNLVSAALALAISPVAVVLAAADQPVATIFHCHAETVFWLPPGVGGSSTTTNLVEPSEEAMQWLHEIDVASFREAYSTMFDVELVEDSHLDFEPETSASSVPAPSDHPSFLYGRSLSIPCLCCQDGSCSGPNDLLQGSAEQLAVWDQRLCSHAAAARSNLEGLANVSGCQTVLSHCSEELPPGSDDSNVEKSDLPASEGHAIPNQAIQAIQAIQKQAIQATNLRHGKAIQTTNEETPASEVHTIQNKAIQLIQEHAVQAANLRHGKVIQTADEEAPSAEAHAIQNQAIRLVQKHARQEVKLRHDQATIEEAAEETKPPAGETNNHNPDAVQNQAIVRAVNLGNSGGSSLHAIQDRVARAVKLRLGSVHN